MSYMGSDSKTIRHNEKFSSQFSGENSKLDEKLLPAKAHIIHNYLLSLGSST